MFTTALPGAGILDGKRTFAVLDYLVFGALMLTSALIGSYFAFFAKQKQNTTKEYLMGGKNMGLFPIIMSLVSRLSFTFFPCTRALIVLYIFFPRGERRSVIVLSLAFCTGACVFCSQECIRKFL